MKGKYSNIFSFTFARINRLFLRSQISNLVTWESVAKDKLEDGCTVLIGMCSKLPNVLEGNLTCLYQNRWKGLKEVFIIVDAEKGILSEFFQQKIINKFSDLNIRFFFYNSIQSKAVEYFKLPYIYSWLSWCIGITQVTTKTILLHDYDALILNNFLETRYKTFIQDEVKMQGIKYYKGNGVTSEHHLVTTFEAFIDVSWVRSFAPIKLFNQIGIYKGYSVDYDTLLFLQAYHSQEFERQRTPVEFSDLVHPSQMIHQYTMFQKFPQKALPCFSVIMIPLYNFISGDTQAFLKASQALEKDSSDSVDLLGDGSLINLSQLRVLQVDWALKQMLQTLFSLHIKPFYDLITYGNHLYSVCNTPTEKIWVGDFSDNHREWINLATESKT